MGTDKAALEIDGQSFLQRAVRLLSSALGEVYVSISPGQVDDALRAQYACIEDRLTDTGPAAGILSAHMYKPDSAWLVLACDMPLLDADSVARLLAERDSAHEAVVWCGADGAGPEPLCALYEPVTLAAFLEHVQKGGSTSPRAWLANRNVRQLEPAEPDRLLGANTREEVTALLDKLARQHSATRNKE
jgi:molybdopterin-guanine dinucleotide biosynthesis protein A